MAGSCNSWTDQEFLPIANAHTIFNVLVSAALFPFVKPVARFASRVVPAREKERKEKLTAYIDEMQYSVPVVALTEAARELVCLGNVTAGMVEHSCPVDLKQAGSKPWI